MSDTLIAPAPLSRKASARLTTPAELSTWAQYGISAALVAAAALVAFIVDQLISAPNLTLIFVLPVVIAGASFGWGPSLASALAGVLTFDFFFTEPRISFRIDSPSDLWAAALLLVTAAIVSSVAARARDRAVEARRAADQAQALQDLAHLVIRASPHDEIVQGAADTLERIFAAPAMVFEAHGSEVAPVAYAGGAGLTGADIEAARGARDTQMPTRAQTYPYDQSTFDFWPVISANGAKLVLGVRFEGERPSHPEGLVEAVAGYLTAALRRA